MNWQRAVELYDQALERPTGERQRFLEDACGPDQEMQRELLALLEARQGSGKPVNRVEGESARDLESREMDGRWIGPYRVVRALGQGGMGLVYLAERADDQYWKQVAIKLVRGGPAAGELLKRFRRERQILASLEHPNIARLLDGGVTGEGTPYLVMEYVRGEPIVEYADRLELGLRERLALFRTVCGAVHHAHQRLVVHRDIKPDNILVTEEGTPKLLDFGIAKLLRADLFAPAEATLTRANPLTPQYASPEQVRSEPVTTATDVYALGLLLYELVTGERAQQFRGTSFLEMSRVICEADPPRPSTAVRKPLAMRWRRQIEGDLETIIGHALEKNQSRRYGSAEQFSEDVRRYLEGRPVAARPDTAGYRAGRFVRRHKLAVAAAGLLAASLVGGITTTTWQARVAQAQRERAERRFRDVRELANSFLFEFHGAIEKLPGATPARQLVVREALKYLDRLAQEGGDDLTLQRERAQAYLRISEIQYQPGFSHLGEREGALASARKALEIRQALAAAIPGAQSRLDLALARQRVGDIVRFMGQTPAALEEYRKAAALVEGDGEPAARRTLGLLQNRTGEMIQALDRAGEAAEWFRKSQQTIEKLSEAHPADSRLRRMLGISHIKLGDVLGNPNLPNLGEVKGAIASYRRGLNIAEELVARDPLSTPFRHDMAVAEDRLGDMRSLAGDHAEALRHHRAAMQILRRQAEQDRADMGAKRDMAIALGKVGVDLAAKKEIPAAIETFTEVLRLTTELAERDPGTLLYAADRAEAYHHLAESWVEAGNPRMALAYGVKGVEIREALLGKQSPGNPQTARAHASLLKLMGEAGAKSGRSAEACQYWRASQRWFAGIKEQRAKGSSGQSATAELERMLAGCRDVSDR